MAIEVHFEKRINNQCRSRSGRKESSRLHRRDGRLASMFLFGLFAYGWQHYQWIQYGYRIEEAQKKKEQLAEIGRQLIARERASCAIRSASIPLHAAIWAWSFQRRDSWLL